MPTRYRVAQEVDWHSGKVENISRSGVLFRCEQILNLGTRIQISFALPEVIAGEVPGVVVCRGRIVRTDPASGTAGSSASAVKILSYRLLRGWGRANAQRQETAPEDQLT